MSDEDSTHFGYRSVDKDAKAGLVAEVFHSVAARYDLAAMKTSPIRKSSHAAQRREPSGRPMRRNAGSELALCLHAEMRLE